MSRGGSASDRPRSACSFSTETRPRRACGRGGWAGAPEPRRKLHAACDRGEGVLAISHDRGLWAPNRTTSQRDSRSNRKSASSSCQGRNQRRSLTTVGMRPISPTPGTLTQPEFPHSRCVAAVRAAKSTAFPDASSPRRSTGLPVTAHRPKTGLRSHGRAGWSPTPPASTAKEPAVTTTLDSQRTCRRSRGRAPQGSLAPARRSLLALLGPVTTIDWYPMPGTAWQFGSAPAHTPPSSPRPDGTMPSGKRQRGG